MNVSFAKFKRILEGHLIQVGAGYLLDAAFLQNYALLGHEWFTEDSFWKMCKVTTSQADFDREYLYGILVSTTSNMQHKIILKYEELVDGILAWQKFKQDYKYSGSKLFRLETLETLATVPYSKNVPGGICTFIDKFQNHMVELDIIAPTETTDAK